jgi:hypothetical protein
MVGAELVRPLFHFPFYGHLVSELHITTHGFLSLSTRLHDYIYKTQYIAPLRVKVTDPMHILKIYLGVFIKMLLIQGVLFCRTW